MSRAEWATWIQNQVPELGSLRTRLLSSGKTFYLSSRTIGKLLSSVGGDVSFKTATATAHPTTRPPRVSLTIQLPREGTRAVIGSVGSRYELPCDGWNLQLADRVGGSAATWTAKMISGAEDGTLVVRSRSSIPIDISERLYPLNWYCTPGDIGDWLQTPALRYSIRYAPLVFLKFSEEIESVINELGSDSVPDIRKEIIRRAALSPEERATFGTRFVSLDGEVAWQEGNLPPERVTESKLENTVKYLRKKSARKGAIGGRGE